MWESIGGVLTKARMPVLFVLGGVLLLVIGGARSLVLGGADLTVTHPVVSWVMLAIGVLLVVSGVAAHFLSPGDAPALPKATTGQRHDVFLAVPMSGTKDEAEYQELRGLALDVIAALETHCGVRHCYFSGRKLASRADFESESVSARVDFEALRNASNFIMIYPRPVLSSVIAEAGFAIGEGTPSVYLVQGDTTLPFLLAEADALPKPAFPTVITHRYQNRAGLLRLIENDGMNFLPKPAAGTSGQ